MIDRKISFKETSKNSLAFSIVNERREKNFMKDSETRCAYTQGEPELGSL
jgi:hypothetical protein